VQPVALPAATHRPHPGPRPSLVLTVSRRSPSMSGGGLNDSQIGRLLGVSSGQIYQDRKAIEKATATP
jgi:hypothetical protein